MSNADLPPTDIARSLDKSIVSVPVPRMPGTIYTVGLSGQPTTTPYAIDMTKRQRYLVYYEMYRQHPIVRAAIEKISKAAVRNGYRFIPSQPGRDVTARKRNALTTFFRKSKGRQLLRITYKDLLIYGESFWVIVGAKAGRPSHALRLHPNAMDPITLNGVLEGWRYGPIVQGIANEIKYETKEVLHFTLDDPEDDLKGLSLLESLQNTVASDLFAMKYNTKFFENSASTGLIFNMKNSTKEEVDRNREYLTQEYAGTDNAHRPIVLEGDISVDHAGGTRTEMQFIELRELNRQEILSTLDIDPSKLGINKDSNRSTSKEADNSFRSETIGSLQSVVEDEISDTLIYEIFGWDDVLFEQEESSLRDKLETAKLFVEFQDAGAFSINDILREIGYPTVEGGDVRFISASTGIIPIDMIEATAQHAISTPAGGNAAADPNADATDGNSGDGSPAADGASDGDITDHISLSRPVGNDDEDDNDSD